MPEKARKALESGASVEEIFVTEARERLAEADRILGGDFPEAGDPRIRTLHRHAHTLKGLANSFGVERMEALSRELVERLAPLEHREGEVPSAERELVRRDFEALHKEISSYAREHGVA